LALTARSLHCRDFGVTAGVEDEIAARFRDGKGMHDMVNACFVARP
jgi:hypothetical protein